jgi:hypothetical protein
MRKELILAIAAGAILGLIIAFGIWRVNSTMNNNQKNITQVTPTPQNGFGITLASIEENDVITSSPVTISGITKPLVLVAISGETKDYLVRSDANGQFTQSVDLAAGTNEIIFTAFEENGNQTQTTLNVVFSSEFAKITQATPEATIKATPQGESSEASAIRQNVQDKVNAALNRPKAYLGTVTDISAETLQLKNAKGEIQQVSSDSTTTIIKTNPTAKTVKFTDIAIGDFVLAMGFKNGNEVLLGKRILITSVPVASGRKVYYANITKVTTKDITVSQIKSKENLKALVSSATSILLKTDGKVTKIKLANIEDNDLVVVFGKNNATSFNARTVVIERQVIATPTPTAKPTSSPKPTASPSE